MRKAPNLIAEELASGFETNERIVEARATGPYLNFFVSRDDLARDVRQQIVEKGEDYGRSEKGAGRRIVIDFSHPNIAKPFGIHHLRSTVIGGALRRIFKTNYCAD